MKWVKLVVGILGALVGGFLIWFGVLIQGFQDRRDPTAGIAFIADGVVVFLYALIFIAK